MIQCIGHLLMKLIAVFTNRPSKGVLFFLGIRMIAYRSKHRLRTFFAN